MSNSTTLLDTISSTQSAKETTANELFDAHSPSSLFGRRASTSSGLTWGYFGGRMLVDGVLTAIANGTLALTASATNYVEATRAGVVSKNTTAFTAGSIPLYTIVAGTSSVTSYTDERTWVEPSHLTQQASVSITTTDVTLSAEQARARHIILSGTLTGDRNLIVPDSGEWIVYNNTSGAFTVTVKTSAGTGDTVDQGSNRGFFADGTNVVATTAGVVSSVDSFSTIAVSGQSDVVADSSADTLTLAAGTGISITTNATTDTITITNTGTASNSFTTIAVSGQSDVVADSATDTLTLVAGSGITITTDPSTDAITLVSTGGAGITLGTPVASTSGTSIDFTGLPAGVKKIVIMLVGVSTNGSADIVTQIGDSGGIETTSYTSNAGAINNTTTTTFTATTYQDITGTGSTETINAVITWSLFDSVTNTWMATSLAKRTSNNAVTFNITEKALSGTLDRVRVTTSNGTDTFDAGKINIQYSS